MNNNDNQTLNKIFLLFYETPPNIIETFDLCRVDDDFRKVYIVDDDKKKIVIKHTSNAFTNEKRINAWSHLIDEYNKLGIYSPKIIPNLKGELFYKYNENGRDYYVYAEEFAKYDTAEHIFKDKSKNVDGKLCYLDDMLQSVGKVASQHFDFCDFPSAYCMLEPFCFPDTTDEGTDCAMIFRDYVRDNIPEYYPRVEKLVDLFLHNKEELSKVYAKLPVSCFQADLNDSNVLLDDNNTFVGLIDYNLSGKEPVLNYTVRAALWNVSGNDLYGNDNENLFWYDRKIDDLRIELFLNNIKCIQKCYTYSDIEREIFPIIFRYMNSFWWQHIDEIKEIKNDGVKINMLLDWLEHQMTRDDIRLP
ncbi:MAG: hypothetical protein RSE93_01385 [Oscillospiraceae bacterium]